MPAKKIYAIGNAHLDPVWLWTRASGQDSMINTLRSALRLMTEYPEVCFTCSSSSLYRWCESADPLLFEGIRKLVSEGRWEIAGGWEVQSDALITRPGVLLKQADLGQGFFRSRFGKNCRIAYNVDSFGHTAMLPSILKEHGFTHYVYGRGQGNLPDTFRWTAPDSSVVTAHHFRIGYGTPETLSEKEFMGRIRELYETGCPHQTFFYGIGDHGGGLYRKHLDWIRKAQQAFPVEFSTLETFFRELEADPETCLPEFSGEIAPDARGIYSACHTVKEQCARAVRHLRKAERLGIPAPELEEPWREIAFDHFHDIMPGTSIRKAIMEDIASSIGFADHKAARAMDLRLAQHEAAQDLSFVKEGGFQLWNPHPFPILAPVCADAYTDPNGCGEAFSALETAEGEFFPLQVLPGTTAYGPNLSPWGRLTAVVPLRSMETKTFAFARRKTERKSLGFASQYALLKKLSFRVFPDRNGAWGFGMKKYGIGGEEAALVRTTEFADGPVCSILQAEYTYHASSILLELVRYDRIGETGVRITVNWQEKETCLKLVLDPGVQPEEFLTGACAGMLSRFRSSGGLAMYRKDGRNFREPVSTQEYAFLDFCALRKDSAVWAFYAPDLYGCDASDGTLRLTLLRPIRPADFVSFPSFEREGWLDLGYSTFSCWILESASVPAEELPRRASVRLLSPELREITGHPAGKPAGTPSLPVLEMRDDFCVAETLSSTEVLLWNPSSREGHVSVNGNGVSLPPFALKRILFP